MLCVFIGSFKTYTRQNLSEDTIVFLISLYEGAIKKKVWKTLEKLVEQIKINKN